MSTIADLPQIDKHVRELDIKAFIDYTEGKYTDLYNVFDYYTKNGYKIYAEIGAFLIDYLCLALLMFCVYETINLL